MKETKLIIICGMSGCGKSTTAQNVSYQYTQNGIAHEWYHEEMKDHPIRWAHGGEFTVSDLHTEEGMRMNIADTYARWEALIQEMSSRGGVYVMEGCLYQTINRYFIPGGYPAEKIVAYYDELMEILGPADPHIIHLYRPNVPKSFRKAFQVRGKRWEHLITGPAGNYDFADETNYQALARSIFAGYQGKKLCIDTSDDDWPAYHREICKFLGIKYHDRPFLRTPQPEKYVGCFEYQDAETKESVTVICEKDELFCSPEWFTHIRMNAIGKDEFELSAFPMVFRYSFDGGDACLTVSGNYDWGIVGKTLKRI